MKDSIDDAMRVIVLNRLENLMSDVRTKINSKEALYQNLVDFENSLSYFENKYCNGYATVYRKILDRMKLDYLEMIHDE